MHRHQRHKVLATPHCPRPPPAKSHLLVLLAKRHLHRCARTRAGPHSSTTLPAPLRPMRLTMSRRHDTTIVPLLHRSQQQQQQHSSAMLPAPLRPMRLPTMNRRHDTTIRPHNRNQRGDAFNSHCNTQAKPLAKPFAKPPTIKRHSPSNPHSPPIARSSNAEQRGCASDRKVRRQVQQAALSPLSFTLSPSSSRTHLPRTPVPRLSPTHPRTSPRELCSPPSLDPRCSPA